MINIYKLSGGGLNYIGATQRDINIRLIEHRSKNNNCLSYKLFEITDDVSVELLEVCSITNAKDRERFWIENTECVNKRIEGRTDKEYYETHKEEIKLWRDKNKEDIIEKRKLYYENNKDEIKKNRNVYYEKHKDKLKEQRSLVITCDKCNKQMCKGSLGRHKKYYCNVID